MKKILSILLALSLCLSLAAPAMAADTSITEEEAAWELYNLGLFKGTGTDSQGFPVFSLDTRPTRAQGVTMLVRLLGEESAALAGNWSYPFTDVPDWAAPYVGYAYANGLTNGRSSTKFDSSGLMSASDYLTFVLRALGYVTGTDFNYSSACSFAADVRLTDGRYTADNQAAFTRGDVAWVSAQALRMGVKYSRLTLRGALEKKGVVSMQDRCIWADTGESCRNGVLWLSFAPAAESREAYTSFTVNNVTVNGRACSVTQYSTRQDVANYVSRQAQALGQDFRLVADKPFALVRLSFNQAAAEAAAGETVRAGDLELPVLSFRFNCTGTLADGTSVEELFVLDYYMNGSGGMLE